MATTIGDMQTGLTKEGVTNTVLSMRQGAQTPTVSPQQTIGSIQTGLTAEGVRNAILGVRNQGFSIDTPGNIPSTALHDNVSPQDVLARRNEMEIQSQQPTFESFLSSLEGGDEAFSMNKILAMALFPPQTALQREASELRGQAAQAGQQVRDVLADRKDTRELLTDLEGEAGLPELRQRLQASSVRVAELQGELIRAEQAIWDEPGQSIMGAESRINPLRRQMTAEIMAEALIQQALVGNVAAAQQNVDRILQLEFAEEERRINSAMMEMQLIEREIQRMEPELQQEAQNRMLQFQVAMEVRREQLADQKWNRENILNMSVMALQAGGSDDLARAISQASTVEEAVQLAGAQLGEPMRFQQWVQNRQISLAEASLVEQQRQNQLAAIQLERDMEAKQQAQAVDEIRKSSQYSVWESRSRVQADLNGQLEQWAGTTERKDANWTELAKRDEFVNQVATLVVYSRNPTLRRAIELGDSDARTSLAEESLDVIKKMKDGQNINPDLLRDRVVGIDVNYNASVDAYTKVVDDISRRYNGVSIPQYMQISRTLDQFVLQATPQNQTVSILQNNWLTAGFGGMSTQSTL